MPLFRLDFINDAVEIKAPVDKVFNFFKEVERWPSWASGIKRAYCKSTGEWREGFRLVMVPVHFPVNLEMPLLSYKENETISWGMTSPVASIIHRFDFEPVDSTRCRVTQSEYAEGIFALTSRPFKKFIADFDRQLGRDLKAAF